MALTTHPPVSSVTSLIAAISGSNPRCNNAPVWMPPPSKNTRHSTRKAGTWGLWWYSVKTMSTCSLMASTVYEAACRANATTLPVAVSHGPSAMPSSTDDCNLHGKPLTNADKWRRVLTVLQDSRMGAVVRQCHCEALRRNATLCRHGAEVT